MRLHKDAKTDLIKRAPLFARCSKRELARISSIADEIDFRAGKVLTREGDRGREFFVLIEGAAEVRKSGRKINTMGDGDFFGEIALVSNVPRTATVTTTSPVRALVIRDTEFRTLLRESSEIQRKVLETLADRLAPTVL